MKQEIRFCHAPDGVKIAYAISGQGPPLVRVLNWLSHVEFDWNSPVWRHWLAELSRRHTFVRYDGRGCGLSDWEAEDFSLAAWVQDLETLVDVLELERFPLIGLCRGAAIAVAYAAKHPDKVSHLILYGAYARGRLKRDVSREQIERVQTMLKLVELGWGQDNPAFRQVYTTLFIPEGTREQAHWFNNLQRISTAPEIAVQIQTAAYSLDVCDLARQVQAPTLVLHAQSDAMVPFEEGRLLAGLIPDARFVPLDSKNHILMEDEPAWQRFRDEVHTFLGSETMTPAPSATGDKGTFPELTPRELEVLDLIAQGLSNGQIAQHLVISPKTVSNHITNIYGKLDVHHRSRAIVQAREAGLGRNSDSSI